MTDATISTLAGDGQFTAYVAQPASAPRAAIVVIQEVFGVNAGIRRKCDRLAEDGYLAIAPDLFWRTETGIQLDPDVPAEMQRGLDLFGTFDQDAGIADIEATIRYARAEIAGGKVGCVGYCLGGRLAYMTAARTDVDASVGYYAVGIDGLLREAHAIAHPLLLHIAGADHSSTLKPRPGCTRDSTTTQRSRCPTIRARIMASRPRSAIVALLKPRTGQTRRPGRSSPPTWDDAPDRSEVEPQGRC